MVLVGRTNALNARAAIYTGHPMIEAGQEEAVAEVDVGGKGDENMYSSKD